MNGIFNRIAFIYYVFVILAIIVVGRIIYVQYINPPKTTSKDVVPTLETIEANRGDILACDGRPLATTVPYYELRMDCCVSSDSVFNKHIDALSAELSNFFKYKSAEDFKEDITNARKDTNKYYRFVTKLVDYSELEIIKQFPLFNLGQNKGGLVAEPRIKRTHPYGRLAYRTIGFINSNGEGVGIEGSCDYYLKGTPGQQFIMKAYGGKYIPTNETDRIDPKDGYDVQTTIDIDIQEVAEKALREQLMKSDNNIEGATALVMEVETGAIRAIANLRRNKNGKFDEDYNYAIGAATEPGSVFKLVTLVSLLEDGYVTLDTPVDAGSGAWSYGGHKYTDTHPIGLVTVQKAFEQSSNIAFAKLAVEHYGKNKQTEQAYADRVQNIKIGERFNLDINGEGRAVIYTPTDAMWSKTTLSSMAIGYAALVTPLHTLTFYNAIANNGKMMKPYFIENYQFNGEIKQEFKPQVISGAICSEKTAKMAQKALRGVVENGTGKVYVGSKLFPISGKTGTARIAFTEKGQKSTYSDAYGNRRYQATFCGFYPSDKPKYSSIVVIYSGKTRGNFYGATQAGPIFKKIAEYIYSTSPDWEKTLDGNDTLCKSMPQISTGIAENQRIVMNELEIKGKERLKSLADKGWIEFKNDTTRLLAQEYRIETDSLANVVNMGLRDAVYLLENQGYKVKFNGHGKVVSQYPAAGSHIAANTVVNLQLSDNETE